MQSIGIQVLTWMETGIVEECLDRLLRVFEPSDILGVFGNCYAEGSWPEDHSISAFSDRNIPTVWCGDMDENTRRVYARKVLNRDWAMIVDADEYWAERDLRTLRQFLEMASPDIWEVRTERYTYWKSREWRIDPPEPSKPMVAIRKDVPIVGIRDSNLQNAVLIESLVQHHLSYVEPDERILRKIKTMSVPWREPIPEVWYWEKWLRWTPEMEDLHPIVPEAYKRAIPAEPIPV